MFRSLYNWMMKQAATPHAEVALAILSFAEASFFPIPPDVMLAPMVLARRERAWRYALVCAAASILGGCLGYFIGYSLEPIGLAILKFFGHSEGIDAYRKFYGHWGFFIILGQGITPIPYKLTTIATGLAHFPLWQFMLASCITRTSRFMLVAFLCRRFGPEILELIEKRMMLVGSIVLAAVVLGFVLLKLLGHHH
ncbi:MAG: YqaA family protein [Asticcacaulis sp.]